MNHVEASYAKQHFGEVMARAASQPVGIRRHRKLVAALVPPDWLDHAGAVDERRAARQAQEQLESRRLAHHQRVGIELLCATAPRRARMIQAAHAEVDRWEAMGLCSLDYIVRWREWLDMPLTRMVKLMCSDAQGWGVAMRQNSPFGAFAFAE